MSKGKQNNMRVIVCGSRDWTDAEFVYRELDQIHKRLRITTVIEGNAFGVDRMAGYWARRNKIDNLKFRADWEKYGKAAGPIRNGQMIKDGKPDRVIAFPGGVGTSDMVRQAHAADIEVITIEAKGP